jgi:hypothetical protein
MTVPVTATPGGFQFVCPYCGRSVVDTGVYAETECFHEFDHAEVWHSGLETAQ